ncbi:hypothetical protein GGR56DRAFT_358229 [Xylariaceae sp. FL0804]|nr:hypothetical protein GGR56DRAFT_358229 [Xylariaceae sp. FL0804]
MLAKILLSTVALAGWALAAPAPVQDEAHHDLVARQGYTTNCTATYSVVFGDDCDEIRDQFNDTFTLAELYSWNPEIDEYCSNLAPGEVICVAADGSEIPAPGCPVPVEPGLVSDCDACYLVQEYDSCGAVAEASGISLADFYLWNPSLNQTSCDNLIFGYNYCVGVPS